MHIIRPLVLAGALAIVSPLAGAGLLDKVLAGDTSAVVLDEQADPASVFDKAFQQPGALAHNLRRPAFELRKIHLASFEVVFPTELIAATSGRDARAYTYFLRNTTEAQMQQITDRAHAAFVAALQARGYEVLPAAALDSTSFREQLAATRSPEKQERSGLAQMMGNSEAETDNAAVVARAAGTGTYPGITFMSTGPLGKLASETGAVVVGVRMRLVFSQVTEDKGIVSNDLEVKPRNVLGLKGTELRVHAPDGDFWQMPLQRAVALPHAAAPQAARMSVDATDRTKAIAKVGLGAVFGFLGGSGRGGLAGAAGGVNAQSAAEALGESPRFEVTAGTEYVQDTSSDLQLAARMLAEALPK